MKRFSYIFMLFLSVNLFSGCSGWLEVEPTDKVDDEKLFADYNGFRNSLNGIYQALASPELYGRELTWGLMACLEQSYDENYLGWDAYPAVQKYDYEEAKFKSIVSGIWLKSYRVIANCNKLIEEIEQKDSTFFPQGSMEKNLILGEALAIRGFMHLDLVRLFGPAMITKDEGVYIPYFTRYPSKFEKKLPTREVLALVEKDLLRAKDLVAKNDTIVNASYCMSRVTGRYQSNGNATGGKFFSFRGIRMNYVAVCGLLARTYLCAGNYTKAKEYAMHVYQTFVVKKKWYSFTEEWDAENYVKLYDDLIFAFYDKDLLTHIADFKEKKGGSLFCTLKEVSAMFEDRNDATDYRAKLATEVSGNLYSRRWMNTGSEDQYVKVQYSLIPVLRMSEIYYILSETMFKESPAKGEKFLKLIRTARSATRVVAGLEEEKFLLELMWEGKKEYLTEGQMFYMFKRLNKPVLSGTQEIVLGNKFIIPTPDNENVY